MQLARSFKVIGTNSYFYKVWENQFPHLHCARKNSLGYCDVCSQFDKHISESQTFDEKAAFIQQKQLHLRYVMEGKFPS